MNSNIVNDKKNIRAKSSKKKNVVSTKLQLLFTIVPKQKLEYYVDILESFDVNMQMIITGEGTAPKEMLDLLGFSDSSKSIIISAITKENASDALYTLDNKFKTVRNGKGIAFTIPLSSVIGATIYRFLTNNRKEN